VIISSDIFESSSHVLAIGNLLDTNLRLVGGTFTFKGVNSPSQHQILAKVLRLSIFVHMSLLLEQHVLSISQVQLKFPHPKLPSPLPSTPVNALSESQLKELQEVQLKA
jgi:1-phosphatidylinositol-3-phosphate 5-kinase